MDLFDLTIDFTINSPQKNFKHLNDPKFNHSNF